MKTKIITGDSLKTLRALPDESVQTCVTSPPYWGLRDYGVKGQLGLEPTPDAYVARMVEIFHEVRRVLKNDGTLWLNLGDSYAGGGPHHGQKSLGKSGTNRGTHTAEYHAPGLKPKDLVGIPWRVAFALQADGWYLRSDIIWHKPNPMPESVTDRPTKAHEYLFLLAKSERYFYDAEAVKEPATGTAHDRARKDRPDKWPNAWSAESGRHDGIGNGRFTAKTKVSASGSGVKYNESFNAAITRTVERRNRRTVWKIATAPYKGAHFATFPPKLIEPCILAGSRPGDVVLDPFAGACTTGLVAQEHGRQFIGIELNPEYVEMGKKRLAVVLAATA